MLFVAYAYVKRESVKFLDAFYEQRSYCGYSRFYVLLYERDGFLLAGGVVLAAIMRLATHVAYMESLNTIEAATNIQDHRGGGDCVLFLPSFAD